MPLNTIVNSQHKHTNSNSYFVPKKAFFVLVLKISDICMNTNLTQIWYGEFNKYTCKTTRIFSLMSVLIEFTKLNWNVKFILRLFFLFIPLSFRCANRKQIRLWRPRTNFECFNCSLYVIIHRSIFCYIN